MWTPELQFEASYSFPRIWSHHHDVMLKNRSCFHPRSLHITNRLGLYMQCSPLPPHCLSHTCLFAEDLPYKVTLRGSWYSSRSWSAQRSVPHQRNVWSSCEVCTGNLLLRSMALIWFTAMSSLSMTFNQWLLRPLELGADIHRGDIWMVPASFGKATATPISGSRSKTPAVSEASVFSSAEGEAVVQSCHWLCIMNVYLGRLTGFIPFSFILCGLLGLQVVLIASKRDGNTLLQVTKSSLVLCKTFSRASLLLSLPLQWAVL